MDLKGDQNHLQKRLDLEFRRILRIIKPYIPRIMNNDYLMLYRMWLEKLSEVDSAQKEERNRYLIELCHQIQDGILKKPFTQLPTPGPLPPFRDGLQHEKVQTQPLAFHEFSAAIQTSPQNTILEENDCTYTIATLQEEMQNWQPKASPNCVKSISSSKQSVVRTSHNSEVSLPHRKRNRRTVSKNIQKQKRSDCSMLKNVVGVKFSETPKHTHSLQLVPELHISREKIGKENKELHFRNLSKCLQEQQPHVHMQQQSAKQCTTRKIRGTIARQQNPVKAKVKNNEEEKEEEEEEEDGDSSWCDLTDVSGTTVTKLGSGDSDMSPAVNCPDSSNSNSQSRLYEMYDTKKTDLMNIISELQKQNLSLTEDVAKYEGDLSLRNAKAETNIHILADEVTQLKNRLQELTEIKTALKNGHFIASSQWQETINATNKELCVTQKQNSALKAEVAVLKQKLEELSSQKQKDSASFRQRLSDMHDKEIEMLKQNCVKHVAGMENKFTEMLTEKENAFTQKLSDLKDFYEQKIFDITNEYEKNVKARNAEIQKLETTIESQYKRTHEEVREIRSQMEENANVNTDSNLEKIAFLQKCLWKMDNLYKKSEKKYNKQIMKLKREIELRDKAIQIQLTTQRAELIANTNTKRQIETDATVVLLEQRYRKLLENHQARFVSEKQRDTKLISELRAMIAKCTVDN